MVQREKTPDNAPPETRLRDAEREIEERDERLRVIFEASQAAIILVSPDGPVTFGNRRAAVMFGIPMEELVGTPYPALLHPDERAAGDDRMRRLIAGELDHVYTERHYRRRDGSCFWGYLSGRRHEDASGRLVALVGVIQDITDRKMALQELAESENRYRALVELAVDAILQGDPDGNIIAANESACSLTGYRRDELLGMNIACLFDEEERRRNPLRFDLLLQGRVIRTERTLTRKDGSPVPIEMISKRMPDGSYQAFIRDCTERIRLQEEQAKAQRLESLGLLAGGIAHDFNNILTGIVGNVSFSRRLVGPDHPASERLDECQKAAFRAGELTRQLLTFARGDEPVRGIVDLRKLLSEASSFSLSGTAVLPVLDLPDDLLPVDGDSGQILQLFNNLLINAAQAMPGGGTVVIRAENGPTREGAAHASRSRSRIRGTAFPTTSSRGSSIRTSPPRRAGRAWASLRSIPSPGGTAGT